MCEMLCEDWEREYKRKVTDKERGRDERDTEEGKREKKKERRRPCLNWPVWPRWAVMVRACQTLCLNSWPGLTCIPCIRPTTTNSSVLFGSFQCQAWESCATHIYAPHFRRPLRWGRLHGFGFMVYLFPPL